MTTINLLSLRREFDDTVAVADFNLEIASGEMVALLGPSGCGKTTTLRMITGLLHPTAGDIHFDGESIVSVPTEKRGAVLVFQKHLLFPTMTVAQNVGFALKMANVPKAEVRKRVEEMLELVELPGFGPRAAHELSGGQQQRVALARGLIARPRVLLLDEPLANLDANLRITMRQLIRSIQEELGTTSIFVTHDQEEAVMLADRVVLMFDGEIQQAGAPNVFYDEPRTAGVARFFRNGNFLEGVRDRDLVKTSVGTLSVLARPEHESGPVVLTVRPELVTLAEDEDQDEQNVVAATVKANIYLGTYTELVCTLDGQPWHVHAPPSCRIGVGERVLLRLAPENIWIVDDTHIPMAGPEALEE